ncbi:hypothetical protein B9479_006111 [Cryptococcus floricola]|uniref:Uncharacterized protein n=1 Tax=Cryptococcus floricola TaxID=2591691 RepID=A0A5D3ARA0_9TREE|nr:hypothetical protein B9479_006111 [Cryptococcus floricola]
MCYISHAPANTTTSSDGICCFDSEACANLVCGTQNAPVHIGATGYGGDITCVLNYTVVSHIANQNGSVDCGGSGCAWRNDTSTSISTGSSSPTATESSNTGAAMRTSGDLGGVVGIGALVLCLFALVPKKFF